MMKIQCKLLVGMFLILGTLALSVNAQTGAYEVDKHYTVIEKAVPTKAPDGQVEVVELFSYACSHCKTFHPYIAAWEKTKPSNVYFRRVPAMFNPTFQVFARAYITADVLGLTHDTHAVMFDAVHIEKRSFRSLNDIAEFYSEHGVAEEKFISTAESFPVVTRMNQENNDARRYGLRGTPSLVVNGKYLVSANENVRTQDEMLKVVDFLVAQEAAATYVDNNQADNSVTDETAER